MVRVRDLRQKCAGVFANPRMRGEARWVIGHKLIEFVLVFVGLKLYTNLMTREAFGEFNLALAAVGLLGDALVSPVTHAYYRYLPQAEAQGAARSASVSFLRLYAAVTIGLALIVGALTEPLSRWLGIGLLTALGTGLMLLTNRWRALGVEISEMRRERRAAMTQNLGFVLAQTGLVGLALWWWQGTVFAALAAYSTAAAVFAIGGTLPIMRQMLARPSAIVEHRLGQMVVGFGIPYGLLLVCQWVQTFAERYILGVRMDFDSVGAYVAAYQVCGVPFMLFSSILNWLGVPIAYERARDVDDPRQLWSADKVLLACVGVYLTLGLAMLPLYAMFGGRITELLTSSEYVLPGGIILALAGARFIQCLGVLLQAFFAVHQRMGKSLLFRFLGGLLVVPISWFAVGWYGLEGAAVGVLISGVIYTILVCASPGGCLHLVRGAHRAQRASVG
jgi:O-antigen/teichoic acid export membrane protein